MIGTVYLVGAGPGDPGLLTLRAERLLRSADAVVHDGRIGAGVLALSGDGAEMHRVGTGELANDHALLTELAGRLERVVRLYPGDPFLLNHGAVAALALGDAGVPVEVVPGVPRATSAVVCAGVPLSSGEGGVVRVGRGDAVRIPDLVRELAAGDALLLEVPERRVPELFDAMDPAGEGATLPVTLVSETATPRQRVLAGPLGQVARDAGSGSSGRAATGEAVLIIGEATQSAPRLRWFEARPLFGRRIIVTRPREQAADFVARLEELGAEVVPFATIRIVDPPAPESLRAAVQRADEFHWIVFTSVNGVRRFWEELRATGRDTRVLAGVSLCAIGPATAAAIEMEGAMADLVPAEHVAEAVVQALAEQGELRGTRILLPRAEQARSLLPEALQALGAEVTDVAAYSTVPDAAEAGRIRRMLDAGEVDLVTFTASSTVRSFVEAVGQGIGRAEVACIGPITSATARELGLEVAVEAGEYTIPGLTAAIVRHYVGASG